MSDAIEVPTRAARVNPVFSRNADWIGRFVPTSDVEIPPGSTAWFRMYTDATATEEIGDGYEGEYTEDGEIRFKIESAFCDVIPAGRQVRCYLSFPNSPSSDDVLFWKGKVVRDD